MFENILRFFINNARLNYLLFVLIFLAGIVSYNRTPKEIFPTFDLDMVGVFGHYTGASIDILDKMAVREIENEIKSIDGISKIATVISSGKFSIILELEKRVDRYNTANKIKDAVSLAKQNLPSDMDEPRVSVLEIRRALINISLSSETLEHDALISAADKLKEKLLSVKNVAEVLVYGDADKYYDITLHTNRIKALGLNESSVIQALSALSYIYPVGKIEDPHEGHYYISTYNGAKSAEAMLESRITVGGKMIRLKEIASVKKRYKDSSTLFSVDTKSAVDLYVRQANIGNAIEIAERIKALIKESQQTDIAYTIHNDKAESIKDRLNIVISNILLGLILITLLVILLINKRMALIISLGIPTSFVMGAAYFYFAGYSINMISLIGVLIALGIIVDDAIVVSENIQQHIEEGLPPKEAAVQGAKEMFKPVTIASLTTLFAFLPALMMSGTMGEVIKLIPIAVSVLVVASLIESFVFLPIHAAHVLKGSQKTTSWKGANRIYSRIIHLLMRYKKTFLLLFVILVPLLTVMGIKQSKFQLFSSFDASTINITLKSNVNRTLEETYRTLKAIEKDLYAQKEAFAIKHVGFIAGWRTDSASNGEEYPYVGLITLELEKLKPQNFVDRYITPNLSFYYDEAGRVRESDSAEISKKLRAFLKEKQYKKRFDLTDLAIVERKVGPIKSDLKLGLISEDREKIITYTHRLKQALKHIEGVVSISDSMTYGIDEIKLKINRYGESLGITERTVGTLLSSLYLERKVTSSFDSDGLIDIEVKSSQKDSLSQMKSLQITLSNGKSVALQDVVDFNVIKSFEKIIKDDTLANYYVYANVDKKKITASEVLEKLAPELEATRKAGVKIKLKGEAEKNMDLKRDMITASTVALLLIMLSILYLFNSFRETLMMMSVIPFAFLGVLAGHFALGLNLSMPSIIGMLGLSGVVVNDGIIMVMNLKKAKNMEDIYRYASKRFRPIILTSITTIVGLSSLVFFPTGQAAIFQPMAVALAFGLAWGTVLNLLYLPVLYTIINQKRLIRREP
jgi:multidrug efflux pump subunit AcrB